MKVKEFFEAAIWNVKSFLHQPIIPIVSLDYVEENHGTWDGGYAEKDKYVYYCVNNKTVKVKALEVLRQNFFETQAALYDYKDAWYAAEQAISCLEDDIYNLEVENELLQMDLDAAYNH